MPLKHGFLTLKGDYTPTYNNYVKLFPQNLHFTQRAGITAPGHRCMKTYPGKPDAV